MKRKFFDIVLLVAVILNVVILLPNNTNAASSSPISTATNSGVANASIAANGNGYADQILTFVCTSNGGYITANGKASNSTIGSNDKSADKNCWILIKKGNDYYQIVNAASGYILSPKNNLISSGNALVVTNDSGSNAQYWKIVSTKNDENSNGLNYKIVCYNNEELAVTFNNSSYILSSYSGAASQNFRMNSYGAEGFSGYSKTMNGTEKASIIGGALGSVVYASSLSELQTYASGNTPYTIVIKANISANALTKVNVGKNKTFIGSFNSNVLNNIHFRCITSSGNIIFKNINFQHSVSINANDDIQVYISDGNNFWIDHCTFSGHDMTKDTAIHENDVDKMIYVGLKADYISVTNCLFHGHKYGLILGYPNEDGTALYSGYPRMTICNNYFDDVHYRAPGLMRYGYFHAYNNFVYGFNLGYTPYTGCNIYSEKNYFEKGSYSGAIVDDKGVGNFTDSGSVLTSSLTNLKTAASSWRPSANYGYHTKTPADAKAWCKAYSGAQASKITYAIPIYEIADIDPPVSDLKYGDLNNDGSVDALDIALMKKAILGNPAGINLSAADVNADGDVNSLDFAVLKSYLMGLIKSLPTGTNISYNTKFTNVGFEDGNLSGWTLGAKDTSGATYASSRASRSGKYELSSYSSKDFVTDIYQDIKGLQSGYYNLTAFVQNGGNQKCAYLYAYGSGQDKCMTAIPVTNALNTEDSQEYGWTLVTVRGIYIKSDGQIRIGFYSEGNAGNWTNFDDFSLNLETNQSQQRKYYFGGDISELTYVEDMGTKFYDTSGRAHDAVGFLGDNGWNIARLRIYNDPGKGRGDGKYYLNSKYQNLEDNLKLAKRAKASGMAIELTFHYSDFWTNGGTQNIPAQWKTAISGLSSTAAVAKLESLIYDYTRNVMQQMVNQGTTPEFVSIGNEIQAGILYPYGKVENFQDFARLLNSACSAVKQVSPSTKVILHLDDAGNIDKYNWFFDSCKTYKVNYDIIGCSYYPYYTKLTAKKIVDFCNVIIARYDKDIILMETGFNFNKVLPDGYAGQLSDNGAYEGRYESSPEGQRDFMLELLSAIKNVTGGRCIGDLYWDPVMVEQSGVGWAMLEATDKADKNVVSNTTLYDFKHTILPVINVYKYNN